MESDKVLRKNLIRKILTMPRKKLIEVSKFTSDIAMNENMYPPEFVEMIIESMNGPERELTPELEEELFGDLND